MLEIATARRPPVKRLMLATGIPWSVLHSNWRLLVPQQTGRDDTVADTTDTGVGWHEIRHDHAALSAPKHPRPGRYGAQRSRARAARPARRAQVTRQAHPGHGLGWVGDAATEPGYAVGRGRRGSRAWLGLRQPGVSARRDRTHPPALQRQALDRLPAAVSWLAALAAGSAGALHRAVLSRRSDGVGRRTSPVRTLPPPGLCTPRGDLARDSRRPGRSRRDRRPT